MMWLEILSDGFFAAVAAIAEHSIARHYAAGDDDADELMGRGAAPQPR